MGDHREYRSTSYSSGFAWQFPRTTAFRADRSTILRIDGQAPNVVATMWAAKVLQHDRASPPDAGSFLPEPHDDPCRYRTIQANHFDVEDAHRSAAKPLENLAEHEKQRLERWISERVLKLACTAEDMTPLADACGFTAGIYKWRPEERAWLTAELDAAYFHLYRLNRDDVEYVLSTFSGTRRRDEGETGSYRMSDLILDAFDGLERKIAEQ